MHSINGYHLLLVPGLVRDKLPRASIGFFLHIAFPSSELFRCLAQRTELLQGMLGADLIAFQTFQHSRHFRASALTLARSLLPLMHRHYGLKSARQRDWSARRQGRPRACQHRGHSHRHRRQGVASEGVRESFSASMASIGITETLTVRLPTYTIGISRCKSSTMGSRS